MPIMSIYVVFCCNTDVIYSPRNVCFRENRSSGAFMGMSEKYCFRIILLLEILSYNERGCYSLSALTFSDILNEECKFTI